MPNAKPLRPNIFQVTLERGNRIPKPKGHYRCSIVVNVNLTYVGWITYDTTKNYWSVHETAIGYIGRRKTPAEAIQLLVDKRINQTCTKAVTADCNEVDHQHGNSHQKTHTM